MRYSQSHSRTLCGQSRGFHSGALPRVGLASLILAAVLLRVFLTIRYANLSDPILWEFGQIAKNLVATGTYSFSSPGVASASMPPAYPLLISAFYKTLEIGLAAHVALATMLLAFEAAIPLLVGWVAAQIWSREVGLVACVLSLFWPYLLIMSGRLHSVPIYTALLILACAILFSERLTGYAKPCLCGLVLGAYANFRYEAILFLLPFTYYMVYPRVYVNKPRYFRIGAVVMLLMGFAVFLTPWVARNYRVFGRFVLSTSVGQNLLMGHNEKATGAARSPWPTAQESRSEMIGIPSRSIEELPHYNSASEELLADKMHFNEAISFMAHHPERELELAFRKVLFFLVVDFTHPVAGLWPVWAPSLLALLVGFLFFVRTGLGDIRQRVLWLLFAIQLAVAVVFFVVPRYRMVVDFIPLAFFSAWATNSLLPRMFQRGFSKKSHKLLKP